MTVSIGRVHDQNTIRNNAIIYKRVDRASVLGNPYYMHSEAQRDTVCDEYETWFSDQMSNKESYVYSEIETLTSIAINYDLELLCHCAPKRCHAETIKAAIDKAVESYKTE